MRARWLASLMMGVGMTYAATGWGDMLYFQDGQSVHGRLSRVTGELIEFQAGGTHGRFWEQRTKIVQRLQLSNRQDRVETRTGQTEIGEVFYVDAFNVELRTSAGNLRIPRLLVRDVALGAPKSPPADKAENDGSNNASETSAKQSNPSVRLSPPPFPDRESGTSSKPWPGNSKVGRKPESDEKKQLQTGRPLVVFPSNASSQ